MQVQPGSPDTTKRFSFVGTQQQRDGTSTKDQRFLNIFPELVKAPTLSVQQHKTYYLKKRPGFQFGDALGTGAGRGVYWFNGFKYSVVGNTLYKGAVSLGTLPTTTGRVGFCDGSTLTYNYLFVTDGTNAYVVKTDDTVTSVTSVNLPVPHLPNPIFIDGYIVIVKANSADLWNSDLNTPTGWTAGNFITAEMFPDNVVGITKNNNYICALGSQTIEFFYDAGNATGSPFARNDSAVQQMGCTASNTISQTESTVVFVGSSSNGGRTVWTLEGFKSEEIGSDAVEQHLDSEGTNLATGAYGYVIRSMGHKWYVLVTTTRTWVYDFDEKLWHEWNYNGLTQFPFRYACDSSSGNPTLQRYDTGATVSLSQFVYQDAATVSTIVPTTVSVTTTKVDVDTYNIKFCPRLILLGDVPSDGVDTIVSVSWSDDDYRTFNTPVNLVFNNYSAVITQLGSFRRRAFRFVYTGNTPMRLEGFELALSVGNG